MSDEMKRWSLQSKGGDWHSCPYDRPCRPMRRVAERCARRKLKRATRLLAEEAEGERRARAEADALERDFGPTC